MNIETRETQPPKKNDNALNWIMFGTLLIMTILVIIVTILLAIVVLKKMI
ncbi:MAG: hypothetical protein QM528_07950 [Phycisphaerales bacterium]|nr:hypothetical protein [Phycisphaerales bacterium]